MLSTFSRNMTYFLAILYTLLGAILFVVPTWSAANFAWKVSPFVAMTIGGWCLGSAVAAWDAARVWRWSAIYSNLVYLWVFGLGETAVLVEFQERLVLNAPVAWLYLLTLAVNFVTAGIGFIEWLRLRPKSKPEGVPVKLWARVILIGFILFVAALVVLGVTARPGSFLTQGAIFPEELTLFTIHAFAAFYFSLVAAAVSLINTRGMALVIYFIRFGIALILPITAAAFFNLDKFDFVNRPGGLLYIGAYLAALVSAILILASHRFGSPVVERTT